MKVRHSKKRLFGTGILLLIVLLAMVTAVLAANGKTTKGGSYSLLIQKVFAEDTPEAAQDMTFTFRIEAQVRSGGEEKPVEEVVKIKGEGSETVTFDGPFKISVIEQTDEGGFKQGNTEWDVTKNECVSSIHVNASHATVNISKDGGVLQIKRSENLPTVTFEIKGKPLHVENQADFDQKFTTKTVTVAAGEMKEFTGLPQGEYTITKLRATDGFSVLVGSREFNVPAGEQGKVHINGNNSKLLITAPPADPDGPIRTHHYRISSTDSRTVDVKSGQTGIVENLTEGNYTIEVSETYNGVKGYTVIVPKTELTGQRKGNITTLTTEDKRKWVSFNLTNQPDLVEFYSFGPLYDSSGQKLTSKVTYQVNYGVVNEQGEIVRRYTVKSSRDGGSIYTLNTPQKLVPLDNRLYFAISGVSNSSAKKIEVKWREYSHSETIKKHRKTFIEWRHGNG